jgi:hypothetical protein
MRLYSFFSYISYKHYSYHNLPGLLLVTELVTKLRFRNRASVTPNPRPLTAIGGSLYATFVLMLCWVSTATSQGA